MDTQDILRLCLKFYLMPLKSLDSVDLYLNEGKPELDLVQDIQDQGRVLLPQSKAQQILACACKFCCRLKCLSLLGVTRLGFRSYPIGLSIR